MTMQPTGPLLELCVLAALEREDLYGYRLTQKLCRQFGLSESTLYPVLRRLRQAGCLRVYDEKYEGRNRRYYALTPAGKVHLVQLKSAWKEMKKQMDICLKGEQDNE